MDELRCDSKKHGEIIDEHTIEVMCKSRFCGSRPGEIVVIHRFDLISQTMTTKKYRDIKTRKA